MKNFSELNEKEKQALLRDDDNNDVPDMLEQGILPEDMGIDSGEPIDETSRTLRRAAQKQMAKFVRVSELKKQMNQADEPPAKPAPLKIKKWLPVFIALDLIVIGVLIYYFMNK